MGTQGCREMTGGDGERLFYWTEPSHIVRHVVLISTAKRSTLLEGLDGIQVWWGEDSINCQVAGTMKQPPGVQEKRYMTC
jgi:hypothetical protein